MFSSYKGTDKSLARPGRKQATATEHFHHRHHKRQGLGHLVRSVSRVTAALANVSSVSRLFSFLVDCSGMILKGFGRVAFFAVVKASSFCIHLSCLVCIQSVVRGVGCHLFYGHLSFIYPIYNYNWRNISTIYIYITRLTSKEIFSPSNKIHWELGRAKDLSAPPVYKNETTDTLLKTLGVPAQIRNWKLPNKTPKRYRLICLPMC